MLEHISSPQHADKGQAKTRLSRGIAACQVSLLSVLPLFLADTRPLMAHDAPAGWKYPYSCCSGIDCRPVKIKAVSEAKTGYVIQTTGEVVPYADTRVRASPDGDFHWCSVAGGEDTRTICLFVPPRSF